MDRVFMKQEISKSTQLTVALDHETNIRLEGSASAYGRSKRIEALFVLRAFYRLPTDKQNDILSPDNGLDKI
jgi:hypothetical protein